MKLLVSKSQGDVLVEAEDGFAASFKNGAWLPGIHFDAHEQMENHTLIRNHKEAKLLYEQAKKALDHSRR